MVSAVIGYVPPLVVHHVPAWLALGYIGSVAAVMVLAVIIVIRIVRNG